MSIYISPFLNECMHVVLTIALIAYWIKSNIIQQFHIEITIRKKIFPIYTYRQIL